MLYIVLSQSLLVIYFIDACGLHPPNVNYITSIDSNRLRCNDLQHPNLRKSWCMVSHICCCATNTYIGVVRNTFGIGFQTHTFPGLNPYIQNPHTLPNQNPYFSCTLGILHGMLKVPRSYDNWFLSLISVAHVSCVSIGLAHRPKAGQAGHQDHGWGCLNMIN